MNTAAFDAVAERRPLDLQKFGGARPIAVGMLERPANQARFMDA
jgi:hypothetical protein